MIDPMLLPVLATFLAETESIAERVNDSLLSAERTHDREQLRLLRMEIARSLHNLKGTSGTFGMADLAALAHAMEDLIPSLERPSGQRAEVVDELLRAMDAFVARLRAYADSREDELGEIAPLLERLARIAAGRAATVALSSVPPPSSVATEHVSGGSFRVAAEEIAQLLEDVDRMRELQVRLEHRKREVQGILPLATKALGFGRSESLMGLFRGVASDAAVASEVLDRLDARVQRISMLPTRTVLDPLQRMVRDLSRESAKRAVLSIEGAEVALDRRILEALRGPLGHLVRNAVDHGIEPPDERARAGKPSEGTIRIRVMSHAGVVSFEVSDDGRGVSPKRVQEEAVRRRIVGPGELASMTREFQYELLFRPGFSTSPVLTETSGRGVGLDLVRTEVRRLRGHVDLESAEGRGTKFILTVPSRFGTASLLGIVCCDQRFGVPVHAVSAVVAARSDAMRVQGDRLSILHEAEYVRLEDLGALLRLREIRPAAVGDPLIVIETQGVRVALAVDELARDMECVIHRLPEDLPALEAYQGAAATASGGLMLVLRPEWLVRERAIAGARGPLVLVVDDSLTARALHRNMLESGGFAVHTAASGRQALAALERTRYAALVCDVEMAPMDGIELVSVLRQTRAMRPLPVLVVSAHGDPDTREHALTAGADVFLSRRECVSGRLIAELKALLARRGAP